MDLIIGGRSQGKLGYAKDLYGKDLKVCDMTDTTLSEALSFDILINIQNWVYNMLKENKDPLKYLSNNIEKYRDKIIIGDEIGSGIVPIDPFERLWRDETGRIYQLIAKRSKSVHRVFAGLGVVLKNEQINDQ